MQIPLHRLVSKDAPRQATIKYWTNATGAAVLLLVIPSLCAIYFRKLGLEEREPSWVLTAKVVWLVDAGLAILWPILSLIERPRPTHFVATEADLVSFPEDEEDDD